MGPEIGSVDELLRQMAKCASSGRPFNPVVVERSPAAAYLVKKCQRALAGAAIGWAVQPGPVDVEVGALLRLVRRLEEAHDRFRNGVVRLVALWDYDPDYPSGVQANKSRRIVNRIPADQLTGTDTNQLIAVTDIATSSGRLHEEVHVLLLTSRERAASAAQAFLDLAEESMRLIQALSASSEPVDLTTCGPRRASWPTLLYQLLRRTRWVRGPHRACVAIDQPFAASADAWRQFLFGHWSAADLSGEPGPVAINPVAQSEFLPAGTTPLSARDLLRHFGLPDDTKVLDRLEKRLADERHTDPGGYVLVEDRRQNRPRYLYYPARVEHVVNALKKSLGRPSKK